MNSVVRLSTSGKRTLTSIAVFPDALLISSGIISLHSLLICTKCQKRRLKEIAAFWNRLWHNRRLVLGGIASRSGKQSCGFGLFAENHPFVDGNKRVGQGAIEVFLLNAPRN